VEATQKSKLIIVSFLLGAILIGGLAYMGLYTTSQEHVSMIHEKIASQGGKVTAITVVPVDESPFEKSGKGNTIYKITYEKDGNTLTAWYRSINHSSIIKEEEAWILPR
jgi:hypothetical protein